jgi:hypothetical protein
MFVEIGTDREVWVKPDSRWLLAPSHPRSSPPDALESAANQPTNPRHGSPGRSSRPVPLRVSSLPQKVANGRYAASYHASLTSPKPNMIPGEPSLVDDW